MQGLNRLPKNALVTEQSGRTEGNSPGRPRRSERKPWVRGCRECEVPWGRHKDLSSPGDLSCAVISTQDLRSLRRGRPGLFPSVLPDCSVTSAFFGSLFSPCIPFPHGRPLSQAFFAGPGQAGAKKPSLCSASAARLTLAAKAVVP